MMVHVKNGLGLILSLLVITTCEPPTEAPTTGDINGTIFDVANAGSGDLTWSVTDNQDWITANPISGTNYSSVNISVSRGTLTAGDYSGLVTISSNAGTGDVVVAMNVPADMPPASVQLYEPTNISSSAMKVSWDISAETDFLSYILYRDSGATVNDNSSIVTTITNRYTVEYTIDNLQDDTEYFYKLYVEDAANQTTGSNVVSGRTLKEPGVWGSFATVSVDLKWISALNSNFAYTVGDSGKIYHWDGSSWGEQASPTTDRLGGVAVIAENDIWISGERGVWHFNGTLWSQGAGYPTTPSYGIDHVSSDSVWVAGVGEIHFYNGSVWSTATVGQGNRIMDLSMNSPVDGWAVTNWGEIYNYNGSAWALVTDFNNDQSYAIWAANGSDYWVAGGAIWPPGVPFADVASVWHWEGSMWSTYTTQTLGSYRYSLFSVRGTSANDVWIVGEDGLMYHWNGIGFSSMNSPTSESVRNIHFIDENDGWAVGDGGVILRYR